MRGPETRIDLTGKTPGLPMGGDRTGRTFISYSRKDDSAASADGLRAWLEKENLSVWQDIVALEGGRDWWSQIEDALRSKSRSENILNRRNHL